MVKYITSLSYALYIFLPQPHMHETYPSVYFHGCVSLLIVNNDSPDAKTHR